MAELEIRDIGPSDQDGILRLGLAAMQEYAAAFPELWDGYRQDIVATLTDPAPGQVIVAEQDGMLLGGVLLYPSGAVLVGSSGQPTTLSEPEFRLLAVDPAARGRGVGPALVRECIRRAQEARGTALRIYISEMLQTAVAMYERFGFVHVPELDICIDHGPRVKCYRLDLGARG